MYSKMYLYINIVYRYVLKRKKCHDKLNTSQHICAQLWCMKLLVKLAPYFSTLLAFCSISKEIKFSILAKFQFFCPIRKFLANDLLLIIIFSGCHSTSLQQKSVGGKLPTACQTLFSLARTHTHNFSLIHTCTPKYI